MVAVTPKWSLPVEEAGDAADMPAASGRLTAAVEAALDRVVGQYTNAVNGLNAAVAGKVNKAGDTMTAPLHIQAPNGYSQVRLFGPAGSFWLSTDPGAGGALTVAHLSGETIDHVAFSVLPDGGTEFTGNLGTRGQLWAYGTTPHVGNFDANNTTVLMRLPSGQVTAFNKSQWSVWNVAASTRRIKRNIRPATPRGILNVETCLWQYRPEVVDDGGVDRLGVIAEQVAEVFPVAVTRDKEGLPDGVDVMALVAGLIQAVKDQQARIEVLEGKSS